MNEFKYTFLILLLIGFLWFSCAQIRPLKGGIKDTEAPVVLSVYPSHLSTMFSANQIVFNFDEYIQLNNINQELIISPPLLKQPKIRVKQKSIVITLDEQLLPNTTYTFNFGDGVVDLNEGNKANDLVYVFSTGDDIDSLSLTGKMLDAYTLKPSVGFRVMLFESDTAITGKKPRPIYFAKTKADGSYKINYLRSGSFYLFGLNDENSNFRADDDEEIALIANPVSPTYLDSSQTILRASLPRSTNPQVDKYNIDSTGYMSFKWDPFFAQITVKALNQEIRESLTLERDSVFVRLKGKPSNRIEKFAVSFGEKLRDTITVPFFESAQKKSFRNNAFFAKKQLVSEPLVLSFPMWVSLADSSAISIKQDSLDIPIKIIFSEEEILFEIISTRKPGKEYDLTVLPGAFKNVSGGINDTLNLAFSTYKTQELGSLKFVFSGDDLPENSYLVLSNKDGKIIYRSDSVNSSFILIDQLPAADYTAQIWVDENENKIFDPLVISEKKQPEKVLLYPQTITVRANWELDLDWKIAR